MSPDISMCKNEDCPIKESCYRFLAIPSYWQSYAEFKYNRELDMCENYWEVSRSESKRLKILTKKPLTKHLEEEDGGE